MKSVLGRETGNGEALVEFILSFRKSKGRMLFLIGEKHRDIIPKTLRENNVIVEETVTYVTVEADGVTSNLQKIIDDNSSSDGNNWIVFFSPVGAQIVHKQISNLPSWKIATIGPTTKSYLMKNGINADAMAESPSPEGLLEAILNSK